MKRPEAVQKAGMLVCVNMYRIMNGYKAGRLPRESSERPSAHEKMVWVFGSPHSAVLTAEHHRPFLLT
jgi:hypothetical protein